MTELLTKSTITNKKMYVNEIFAKIANKYDLLNNLMTFGLHLKWKTELVKLAIKENNLACEVLDLCTGTCDIPIIFNNLKPDIKITCIDNCKPMLEAGKKKIENKGPNNIEIILLDTEALQYKSHSFDIITIGFGLRNLIDKNKCINSAYEMLRNNGALAILDLGYPKNIFWQKLFFFYFFKVVPILGQTFAKNKEAYSYLPNSLLSWYKQEELKDLILKTGFKKCYYKNILGGVVAIHVAVK